MEKYWYITLGLRGQSIILDMIPFFWATDNGDRYKEIREYYSAILGYGISQVSLRMKGEI